MSKPWYPLLSLPALRSIRDVSPAGCGLRGLSDRELVAAHLATPPAARRKLRGPYEGIGHWLLDYGGLGRKGGDRDTKDLRRELWQAIGRVAPEYVGGKLVVADPSHVVES